MNSIRDYLNLLAEEQLNELSDAPYNWELRADGFNNTYDFQTPDYSYSVWFCDDGVSGEDFSLIFYINNHEDSEGITRTGNALKVFGTIKQITKHFLDMHRDMRKLSFTARKDEPSRVKLYRRLLKVLEEMCPGYTGKVQNDYSRSFSYILEKNKPLQQG